MYMYTNLYSVVPSHLDILDCVFFVMVKERKDGTNERAERLGVHVANKAKKTSSGERRNKRKKKRRGKATSGNLKQGTTSLAESTSLLLLPAKNIPGVSVKMRRVSSLRRDHVDERMRRV